jgi:CHAT domain-containing protein
VAGALAAAGGRAQAPANGAELAALLTRARADADRDFAKAAAEYEQAVVMATELHATREVAVGYRGLGLAHYRQGHTQTALDSYNHGLPAAETAGDRATLAELLRGVGVCERQLGHLDASLDAAQRSLAIARELGDTRAIAGMLGNISAIYGDIGDMRKRLETLQQSLAVAEANHDAEMTRSAYDNLAVAYMTQGDLDVGIAYLEKNIRSKEEAKAEPRDLAGSLNNAGIIYRRVGRNADALAAYSRALALYRGVGDERGIAIVLINIGALHRLNGEYAAARANLEEAVALHDAIGHADGRTEARMNLAYVLLAQHETDAALQTAQTGVTIARAAGLNSTLMFALPPLGDALLAAGRRDEARAVFTDAVNLIESMRRNLAGGAYEGGAFLDDVIEPYHALLRMAIEDGRATDALALAEQGKARQLFDLLHTNRTEITRAMTADERAEERRLAADVSRANVGFASARDAVQIDRLRNDFAEAAGRLDTFRAALYRTHPELQLQRGDLPPLSLAELSTLVDADTALVEFVVTEPATFAVVVTRNGSAPVSVAARRIAIDRRTLDRQVEAFRRQLASRDLTYRDAATRLYQRLLGPLAPELRGKRLVGIVPDGGLWSLPFQALVGPSGRHVIEDHAIFYAPSLTTLAATHSRPAQHGAPTLLAMSAPPASIAPVDLGSLPQSVEETRQLQLVYGRNAATVVNGVDAREDRWKADAGRYRVLHLSTHGVLNSDNPLYSYLVLGKSDRSADDGLLEAREILDLDLHASVAVLSACETARGRFTYGEGEIGLSWAFLVAGTPTTVVSQWKVDAESTSELMVAFHRRLVAGGSELRGRAHALQQAAVQLANSERYRHPFYWAAFAVIGDGY